MPGKKALSAVRVNRSFQSLEHAACSLMSMNLKWVLKVQYIHLPCGRGWVYRYLFIQPLIQTRVTGAAGTFSSIQRPEKHPGQDSSTLQGRHTNKVTHKITPCSNLAPPVHMICMSLDCGRKPSQTRGIQASSKQTTLGRNQLSDCQVTALTTVIVEPNLGRVVPFKITCKSTTKKAGVGRAARWNCTIKYIVYTLIGTTDRLPSHPVFHESTEDVPLKEPQRVNTDSAHKSIFFLSVRFCFRLTNTHTSKDTCAYMRKQLYMANFSNELFELKDSLKNKET